MTGRLIKLCSGVVISVFLSAIAFAGNMPSFSSPGDLESGSGNGLQDSTVYYPAMRFPIQEAPAFANSQVYRPGGKSGGSQCSGANYDYPWRDTYCETRSWGMPLCPIGKGHQGQDIRPATCQKDTYWAVAAEDGLVANIGGYSVSVQTPSGTIYRYLHLNMNNLAVHELDEVRRGDKIGLISNHFGGTPTTIHLHFDIRDTILISGSAKSVYMPPYTSLVEAYKRLLAGNP